MGRPTQHTLLLPLHAGDDALRVVHVPALQLKRGTVLEAYAAGIAVDHTVIEGLMLPGVLDLILGLHHLHSVGFLLNLRSFLASLKTFTFAHIPDTFSYSTTKLSKTLATGLTAILTAFTAAATNYNGNQHYSSKNAEADNHSSFELKVEMILTLLDGSPILFVADAIVAAAVGTECIARVVEGLILSAVIGSLTVSVACHTLLPLAAIEGKIIAGRVSISDQEGTIGIPEGNVGLAAEGNSENCAEKNGGMHDLIIKNVDHLFV